jgi:N-acetylmuramoyl-L-alanine amidase CwlA
MNLKKLIFTQNACYKAGRTVAVKGICVHSTGANNPNLKRYVGPDDGLLGQNQYGNHWNQNTPDGRQVCVHGFIGKLADGSIATYQTLPWNHRGWHGGSGTKGSVNDTHIGFEICEDALMDASYFNAVYKEAAELCAYLCKEFNLDPTKDGVLICHSEGHSRGIASNHGDVMHWFPRFGKSMDTFRAEVKRLLGGGTATAPTTPSTPSAPSAIKAGDLVTLASNATYYDGKTVPAWVKADRWYVSSLKGDRAVIDRNESSKNSIKSPVNVKFLTVAGSVLVTGATAGFTPYLVKVTADELNIRKGAGTNTAIVGSIKDKGTYTIVAESDGTGATKWGKLKSGAGYISLDYVKRV